MKKLFILCFLILCRCILLGAADYLSILKTINTDALQHPYLVFNNQDKQILLQRIKDDPKLSEIMEVLKIEGRRYMLATSDLEPTLPENFLNARYIATNPYRDYQNYFMNGAETLAFLYQMTGDESYMEKAFYCADKLCAMENWVQGAHYFENIYTRVWPYGAGNDQVVFSYDITAAEYTVRMSLVYDWLYPAMTKAQRDRIRGALLEKAITRVRGCYEFFWWATAYKCNWSGICHSGLGIASLAILKEHPQLIDVVARTCEGVENMIANIDQDGGWQEGRGYWNFGVSSSTNFIEMVKRVTNGRINLFNLPGIMNTPADFALFGLTGAFGDGGGGPVGTTCFFNKIISETKNTTAMWYYQNYLENRERQSVENRSSQQSVENRNQQQQSAQSRVRVGSMWDLIWQKPADVQAVKPEEASKHFRGIDWAFLRKDFGNPYMQVATKAGANDDPHHGHLDVGTVILTWQGETIVGEWAAGSYDLFVFNEMRWEYLLARSKGHNVVLVNGEEQIQARHKDQPLPNRYIGGKIEQFRTNPQFAYTKTDATQAYANTHLKSWKRWLILDKETNIVIVLDKVGCARGAEIDVLFHPNEQSQVNVTDKVVAINGARSSMEMRALANSPFTLEAGRQAHFQIIAGNSLRWIPYYRITAKAPRETTCIASIFYPTALKDTSLGEAQFTFDESGASPVITCAVQGKTLQYSVTENDVVLNLFPR